MSDLADIEDIYPLTAVQQAWLLHSLRSGAADPGFQHNRATLHGPLNVEVFQRAWQAVVDRHSGLRTSLHWRGLDRTAQVVHRRTVVPFTYEDCRVGGDTERAARIESFLAADRERGFDLERAPLMRVAVLQTRDECHEMVWSLHHLMMDGWSTALVSREVFSVYDALLAGATPRLPRAGRFKDYVTWLQSQRADDAERYWRDLFAGATGVTPLGTAVTPGTPARHASHWAELSPEISTGLEAVGRRLRVTPSSMVLGVWTLILSRWTGVDDVIFGTTVSGRAPEIPNVDTIVGLMLNTMAVRVCVPEEVPLSAWLRQIQADRAAATRYQHTPLEQVMGWSGLPAKTRLFDSLLVFENYPDGGSDGDRPGGLRIDGLQGAITSAYPLNAIVLPGSCYRLLLHYDVTQFGSALGAWLERAWHAALAALADGSDRSVAELRGRLPAPDEMAAGVPAHGTRAAESAAGDAVARNAGASARATGTGLGTKMEHRVAGIWSDELDVELVDVESNFFDLGGYSLLATRVMERVEREIGVRLELQDLVFQTLRQVAAKCERLAKN